VAFDADSAGQEAAKRGIAVAMEEGLSVRVITIPPGAGKDADECLKKNPTVWFEAIAKARSVMDWYLAAVLAQYDIKDVKQKQKAAGILLAEIMRIPFAVERDDWLKKLSNRLDIELAVLREEVKKMPKISARSDNKEPAPAIKLSALDAKSILLCNALFALLLKFPQLLDTTETLIKKEYLPEKYLSLYELVLKQYNSSQGVDPVGLGQEYNQAHPGNLVDILLLQVEKDFSSLSVKEARVEVVNIAGQIKQEWTRGQRKELQKALMDAEQALDRKKIDELMIKLQTLN
jgi:DNA primase